MDEVREAVIEILEGGMKEEYIVEELGTTIADYIDALFEELTNIKSVIEDIKAEVL